MAEALERLTVVETVMKALEELQWMHHMAAVLANFVRALVGRPQECLLMARTSVREAIGRGVRRSLAVALAMAEAHTSADLTNVEGFPEGESLEDYADLLPQYGPTVNVVAALFPLTQVLNEDL